MPPGQRQLPGLGGDLFEQRFELLLALPDRVGARPAGDLHALAAQAYEQPCRFQQRIGLGNGHRVDLQVRGDLPDRRQQPPRRQTPPRDPGADLLDDLPIDRHPGRRFNVKQQINPHAH